MSSYNAPTVHPETGKIESASWLDDYFGSHRYGVKFADGGVHQPEDCEQVGPKAMKVIEAAEVKATMWENAYNKLIESQIK